MNLSVRMVLGCTLALAVGVLACGCGSGETVVKVRGKLIKGGQPYQAKVTGSNLPPGEEGMAEVTFYPVKSDNEVIADEEGAPTVVGAEMATVKEDGTFELLGPKGKGIPPGKYRIVVKHIDPTGADLLKAFFNEQNSRITRDVTEGAEIIIDLDKRTG